MRPTPVCTPPTCGPWCSTASSTHHSGSPPSPLIRPRRSRARWVVLRLVCHHLRLCVAHHQRPDRSRTVPAGPVPDRSGSGRWRAVGRPGRALQRIARGVVLTGRLADPGRRPGGRCPGERRARRGHVGPLRRQRLDQRGRCRRRHLLPRPPGLQERGRLRPFGGTIRRHRSDLRALFGLEPSRLRRVAGAPVPPARRGGGPGRAPVLVVGTTHDPATPYAWAVSVAHQLSRAVLLTREGNDHVAYFYSPCVRSYVQTYLIGGGAPATGSVCTS